MSRCHFDLTFQAHIKTVTKTALYNLSNIVKIRFVLTMRDVEILVHGFVSSTLNYCNTLSSGLPAFTKSLQLVQNTAARDFKKTGNTGIYGGGVVVKEPG